MRRPPNISALLVLAAASGLASCKTVATPEAVTRAPDLAPLSSDRAISWRPYDLFHDPEPVVVGDRLFVATGRAVLECSLTTFEVTQVHWHPTARSNRAAPGAYVLARPEDPASHLLVGTFPLFDRSLRAFDPPIHRLAALNCQTKTWEWVHSVGDAPVGFSVIGGPLRVGDLVVAQAVEIYTFNTVGPLESLLVAFDVESGALRWSVPLGHSLPLGWDDHSDAPTLAPLTPIDGERVLVSWGGSLACVSAPTGDVLWALPYARRPGPTREKRGRLQQDARDARRAVIANGIAVAAPPDGAELLGVEISSGSVVWRRRRGWAPLTPLVAIGDQVLARVGRIGDRLGPPERRPLELVEISTATGERRTIEKCRPLDHEVCARLASRLSRGSQSERPARVPCGGYVVRDGRRRIHVDRTGAVCSVEPW